MSRWGVYFYIEVDADNYEEAREQAVIEAHERLSTDNIEDVDELEEDEDE